MKHTVKCSNCNLVNFATSQICKRCKNPLENANFTAEGTTLNININLPGNVMPQSRTRVSLNEPQPQSFAEQQQTTGFHSQQYREQPSYQPTNYQSINQPMNPVTPGFDYWSQTGAPSQFAQPAPHGFRPPYGAAMPYQGGVYRRGGEVVVHRNANLPPVCVKCGNQYAAAADISYVRQKYRWHNPLVYIAVISPLIYVILAIVLSHRAEAHIPLCQQHLGDRNSVGKYMLGVGVLAAIAVVFFFSAGHIGFAVLLAFGVSIGLCLAHEYLYKPLQASKIENDYVYLKGVGGDYLNQFPYC